MDPLYLVDGSGYIFRAYYAIRPLSNTNGLPTNALYGFTRMLGKLLRDVNARYIAVTFDTPKPTFRHELYSEYKANRAECPEDLVPQMPYFRKIVQAFGISCLEKAGFEADDIIATLVRHLRSKEQKIIVVSGDKDLLQLVGDEVEVWDAMRDTVFNSKAVEEKFGVTPEQMIDFLALTGDSSDNIPGVKGVGPKSATKLLGHFRTIDNLLENIDEIEQISGLRGALSIKKGVESGSEVLRLSKRLVSLDDEVEPFCRINTVEEFLWKEALSSDVVPLFEELEFLSLVEELPLNATLDTGADNAQPAKDYSIVTKESLSAFVSELGTREAFAFDTETTSLDVLDCALVGMSFCWQAGKAHYLPFLGEGALESLLDPVEVRDLLNPIFSNPEIKKTGQNLKFDIGVLEEHGYTVRGVSFDAMLCSYVLNPESRQHGLKELARVHLKESMVSYEDLVGDRNHIGEVDVDFVSKYACHDADSSWALKEVLEPMLGERGEKSSPSLRRVFEDVEMPLVPVLSHMERKGIKVDTAYLKALETELSEELVVLEASVYEKAGMEFNLNSPKQLSGVLFEHLAIPTKGVKKTKSGFSTDAGVLSRLAPRYEIVSDILDYRELFKLKSTYVQALQRLAHPKTGRIHTSFNQAITATGRLSSSEPNLQNIPIRNPRGRRIRKAFVAEQGCVLISADYSQIELRILADLSGDETLQAVFLEGEDIHMRTARELFGDAGFSETDLKEYRRIAKTINFGIIYGMGAFRLAGDLGVSRAQAQEYIEEYFARYPRVLDYFDTLKQSIEERGFVETMYGRRRYLKDIDTSGRDAGYAGRSLTNMPIQGSAAEVIKVAMVNIYDRLLEFRSQKGQDSAFMVLQVHDELVCEVREKFVNEIREIVVKEMESAVELTVPLKVDVRVAKSWSEG